MLLVIRARKIRIRVEKRVVNNTKFTLFPCSYKTYRVKKQKKNFKIIIYLQYRLCIDTLVQLYAVDHRQN